MPCYLLLTPPKHVLSPDISPYLPLVFHFSSTNAKTQPENAVLIFLRTVVPGKIDLKNISTLLICSIHGKKAPERIYRYTTALYRVSFHPYVFNHVSDYAVTIVQTDTRLARLLLRSYEPRFR